MIMDNENVVHIHYIYSAVKDNKIMEFMGKLMELEKL